MTFRSDIIKRFWNKSRLNQHHRPSPQTFSHSLARWLGVCPFRVASTNFGTPQGLAGDPAWQQPTKVHCVHVQSFCTQLHNYIGTHTRDGIAMHTSGPCPFHLVTHISLLSLLSSLPTHAHLVTTDDGSCNYSYFYNLTSTGVDDMHAGY